MKWGKVVRVRPMIFVEDASTSTKFFLEQSCGLLCQLSIAWMFLYTWPSIHLSIYSESVTIFLTVDC